MSSTNISNGVVKDEDTFEIMINGTYGGFGFSDKAVQLYCEKIGIVYTTTNDIQYNIERDDINMIEIVKKLGPDASGGRNCVIHIDEIPTKYKDAYIIQEYDGLESVMINHTEYKLQSEVEELKKEYILLSIKYQEVLQELEVLRKNAKKKYHYYYN